MSPNSHGTGLGALLPAALLAAFLLACGSRAGSAPVATLTPELPSQGSLPVKTSAIVEAVEGSDRMYVRIEGLNGGEQAVWNNALLQLRKSDSTIFSWTSLGTQPSGASAASFSDLKVGERISLSFEPRTFDTVTRSYAVGVIGRAP